MLRRSSSLLLVVALSVGVALPASAATVSDFIGVWTSVDNDGSNQVMLIRPGGASDVRVLLFDDGASVCDPTAMPPALARGSGSINVDRLDVDFRIRCLDGSGRVINTAFFFDFVSDGKLTDGVGVTWTRVFP